MAWRSDRPFNELPPLPPAVELETKAVLKQCVEARAALAELKRSAELIPNPGILVSTLPLLEAQASSEIENVVTTADALFQHLHDAGGNDAATREAFRYREALLEGFRSLGDHPISTRTAEAICSRIKGVDMRVRQVPGTAIQNTTTGQIIYTPPDTEARLRTMLGNWESFIHAVDNLDPLTRLAVAHYQFEAVHPFTDGNGRTGRVLNSLLLVEWGLLGAPILYLSRYIIATKAEYYRRLLRVTSDGEWEAWILYVVRGIEQTARWTSAKVDAIRALREVTAEHVRSSLPAIYSHELLDVLFQQPYCRIANLVEAGIVARQAAARYLKQLASAHVVREEPVGRDKLFVNTRLIRILTRDTNEFEAFPN